MEILKIVVTLALLILLALPLGKYIYHIISGEKSFADKLFGKIDNGIYKLTGVIPDKNMTWKQYFFNMFFFNVILGAVLFLAMVFQGSLFLNPNKIGNMNPALAFNTAISFITNTNLQDYSGESGVSYLIQFLLTGLMFLAPASGLAVTSAFLRGITGAPKGLGNFYGDVVRFTTRLLIPLSIVVGILLISQGVPQTLSANAAVNTIENKTQLIALGPVSSLEAIKNLGSNGGGFFGGNSAHPYENPNPITNLITMISLGLISTGTVFAFGHMLKNKKQALILFIAAFLLLVGSIGVTYYAESQGNAAFSAAGIHQTIGNMEGKETRFGVTESALFSSMTTAYQVGAVNNMHDSLTPLGGLTSMWNMMLQVAFGGKGTGFMYLLMYAVLTVFLCGLMVGRTPEFLGRKIESFEMKMIAIVVLLHPIMILLPTALATILPSGFSAVSNPSYHGFSQMLYQFTSSAANNGSGFEGLGDNTIFWNISAGIVMFLGRYLPIAAMLALAGSMGNKAAVPNTIGTFRTDNALFGVMLISIIVIVGALTFFPVLALGPLAEHLTLLH